MRALRRRLAELLGGEVTLEELKHKPGRRLTLRAHAGGRTAIVKVYASDRAAVVAARVRAIAVAGGEPQVPHVLHVDPELHLVVLSEVEGTPLSGPLLEGDLKAPARAGAALGAWHRRWEGVRPVPLADHSAERELDILWRQAAKVPAALASRVRAAAAGLNAGWHSTGVVHRDLYEEQILVGHSVGLIDLDDVALGPPELDIANLIAHLELLALRSGRSLDDGTDALLGAYREHGLELDAALLERCRKLSLLRLACIHREPDLIPVATADRRAESSAGSTARSSAARAIASSALPRVAR
jgi:Ser/Thr protein kinase RdoA (MazF antagonist)